MDARDSFLAVQRTEAYINTVREHVWAKIGYGAKNTLADPGCARADKVWCRIRTGGVMKHYTRLFNTLPKRIAAGAATLAAVLVLPIATLAAPTVRLDGTMGIANVTRGDTTYRESVAASYDEVVKVQMYYHNRENPDSGRIANDLRLKFEVPATAGGTQTIRGTLSSPDANTVTDTVSVNLDRADAYLEFIPGTAKWKHNAGTNENVNIVETTLSDEIVYGGTGLVLEDAKPCFNFDATVTILVRVRVPGIKIDKKVRVKGQTQWTTSNSAKPGETLEYLLTYQNAGNTIHKDVEIRDNLPQRITYVPGSTKLTNANGSRTVADGVTTTGIIVGNYGPGANAHVTFEAKLPEADKLACGVTEFRNVGVAQPKGMNEFYNTAITRVEKKCEEAKKPVCDALEVTVLGDRADRKIRATVRYSANGATLNSVTYNFGDNSTPLVTTNTTVEHTYAADGTFTVTASLRFNGVEGVVTSESCTKKVAFVPKDKCPIPGKEHLPADSPECKVTPVTPELPKTGAAGLVGLFAATSVAGGVAHNVVTRRRK